MNVRFISQAYGVSGIGEYGNHHDRVAAVKTLFQQREGVAMGGVTTTPRWSRRLQPFVMRNALSKCEIIDQHDERGQR